MSSTDQCWCGGDCPFNPDCRECMGCENTGTQPCPACQPREPSYLDVYPCETCAEPEPCDCDDPDECFCDSGLEHCCVCGGSPYCVCCRTCGASCIGSCTCPVDVQLHDGRTLTLPGAAQ